MCFQSNDTRHVGCGFAQMFEQICASTISRITNGPVVKETLVIVPMGGA